MRYVQGSLAEELQHEEVASSRPSFSVLVTPRGGQHAERYLSPLAATAVKCVIAVAVCVMLMSIVRVALITETFQLATANSTLNTQIDEARATGSELEVQQAIVSNSERIRSIAVDVYGMETAGQVTTISAPVVEPAQTAAE